MQMKSVKKKFQRLWFVRDFDVCRADGTHGRGAVKLCSRQLDRRELPPKNEGRKSIYKSNAPLHWFFQLVTCHAGVAWKRPKASTSRTSAALQPSQTQTKTTLTHTHTHTHETTLHTVSGGEKLLGGKKMAANKVTALLLMSVSQFSRLPTETL